MPDAHSLLISFRDELAVLDARRADLRGQLEALDREHERLAVTIGLLDERVGAADAADALADLPLADRIVDALGTSGLRRAALLRTLIPQGFTPSAIDSAVNRLVKRAEVVRQGRRIVRVRSSELAESAGRDTGRVDVAAPGSGPLSEPESVDPGSDAPPVPGGVPGSVPDGPVAGESVADEDDRPMTQRVRDAVQVGVDTPKALVRYFAARGVKTSRSVTRAVWGLRKRGVLADVAGGRLVVAPAGPSDLDPPRQSPDSGSSSSRS